MFFFAIDRYKFPDFQSLLVSIIESTTPSYKDKTTAGKDKYASYSKSLSYNFHTICIIT